MLLHFQKSPSLGHDHFFSSPWGDFFPITTMHLGALDAFITAVDEHDVLLPNKTEIPVSPVEALLLVHKNIDIPEIAIKQEAQQLFLYLC